VSGGGVFCFLLKGEQLHCCWLKKQNFWPNKITISASERSAIFLYRSPKNELLSTG
jgi:hypothetical protein